MFKMHILRALALILALLGAVTGGATIGPVAAQTIPGQTPGIVASGYGRASVPAESASVQIIVTHAWHSGMVAIEPPLETIPAEQDPNATPGPEGDGFSAYPDNGMMMDPGGMMPPSLTESDLGPILDVVAAAGISRDAIDLELPAFSSAYFGPGGTGSAQLRFTLDDPVVEDLAALVDDIRQATTESGLTLEHVGVAYAGTDCAALEQEARVVAVADARARAEGLAEALGANLGELSQAAENPFFGAAPDASEECAPLMMGGYGPYGPGMTQPFDPNRPAEVVVYAMVTLTYAVAQSPTA